MAWDRGMCNTPDPKAVVFCGITIYKHVIIQYATQYNINIQGNSDHAYHT